MDAYDVRLLRLAGRQHQVVSREQLLELGTADQIKYRLRLGMLERVHQCAYRIAGAEHTWRQSVLAGCFAGGKFSVASFRSAGQLWTLPGGAEIVEITSPRHRRARHADVIPHESFFLCERDITYIDNIPLTRPARTIDDMGLLVEYGVLSPEEHDHAMLEAVRRDLVDEALVWSEWERLGGEFRPGGRAVKAMLENFVRGSSPHATKPELRLLQLVRAAGLPEPVLQYRVWLTPTRWVDLDLAWPEYKVFAEFDPYRWHGRRDTYMTTIARRLDVELLLDWYGLPVTDDELDSGAPRALALLARKLVRR